MCRVSTMAASQDIQMDDGDDSEVRQARATRLEDEEGGLDEK